jgi:hypothetical protein
MQLCGMQLYFALNLMGAEMYPKGTNVNFDTCFI